MLFADVHIYVPLTVKQTLCMREIGTNVSTLAMDIVKGVIQTHLLVYSCSADQVWGIKDPFSNLLHLNSEEIANLTLLPTHDVRQEYIRQLIEEREYDAGIDL